MNATPDRRIKTVLISTVHSPDDVRIFHREAVSLAEAGYAVAYICPGTKSEVRNGVRLIPIEKPKSRLARLASILTVVKLALREDAEVYHVHDPELILALAILRIVRPRAKLIYDAHENFRRYILWEAPLRPRFLRFPVAAMMIALEYFARFVCSAIVAPNASILENFGKCRTAEVSNFPSLAQLPDRAVVDAPRPRAKFAFAGLMCPDRRTHMMVQALDMIPESFEPTLVLAGYFREPEYEAYVRSLPGWRRVTFLGQISRPEVMDLYAHSTALIEMAEIIGNVVDSRPNTLCESLGYGRTGIQLGTGGGQADRALCRSGRRPGTTTELGIAGFRVTLPSEKFDRCRGPRQF